MNPSAKLHPTPVKLPTAQPRARVLAIYLPQFHPIPENDASFGKGYTEWHNVVKARPLFPGHQQPRRPAALGYYDLRVPEVRAAQAELAKRAGIEAFCYWHYWFNGRSVLSRPFEEVLASGKPNFPFCLGWANHSWTHAWVGRSDRIIIEQTYGGIKDHTQHFYSLLKAFQDERYVRVDGKPFFFVYNPSDIPDCRKFTDTWRELALKEGLGDMYLVGNELSDGSARQQGFDASTLFFTTYKLFLTASPAIAVRPVGWIRRFLRLPLLLNYERVTQHLASEEISREDILPVLLSGWDNTSRLGWKGSVVTGLTPETFGQHVRQVLSRVADKPFEKRLVLLKSWNEWAEGNYLEPDTVHGSELLASLRKELLP